MQSRLPKRQQGIWSLRCFSSSSPSPIVWMVDLIPIDFHDGRIRPESGGRNGVLTPSTTSRIEPDSEPLTGRPLAIHGIRLMVQWRVEGKEQVASIVQFEPRLSLVFPHQFPPPDPPATRPPKNCRLHTLPQWGQHPIASRPVCA
jgi:hypothetical protein